MITKRLLMYFLTSTNRELSISVDDPRDDLTEAEIKAVMELIVTKNIFAPSGVDFVSCIDAKIVVTDTTDYDLVV